MAKVDGDINALYDGKAFSGDFNAKLVEALKFGDASSSGEITVFKQGAVVLSLSRGETS